MSEIQQSSGGNELTPKTNEYAELGTTEKASIIRSARNLESYKRVFGSEFGKAEELILDVGAGDTTMADEIEELTDHKAAVIRFDRDYAQTMPDGSSPAVAGDATQMPFANESFDRIVSHNMMYYLGREKGVQAIDEMLRVLKPGGEMAIYPAKPFGIVNNDLGYKEKTALAEYPKLIITKPIEFAEWDEAQKQAAYLELARAVTLGDTLTKLVHWGVNRAIERKGTHRTIERGKTSSL